MINLFPYTYSEILGMIKLFEVYPGIFALSIKDDFLRAMLFLRYQEYYESYSEDFRGKHFLISDYIDWYKTWSGKDNFTYTSDWAGFNLPSNSIVECMWGIPDRNVYDDVMKYIVEKIGSVLGDKPFYLIGVDKMDCGNFSVDRFLDHEIAHGLYSINSDYKNSMLKNIYSVPVDVRILFKKNIAEMGYCDDVLDDEMQAYLSTGLHHTMDKYSEYSNVFSKTFNDFYSGGKEVEVLLC
jgi:hypothetical protein